MVCGVILVHLLKSRTEGDERKTYLQENNQNTTARNLTEEVRILCFILTGPKSYRSQNTIFIRETWGKRCNTLLFMASYYDPELPTVALPSPEGWHHLWNKTKESFKYVFQHYEGKYDWVLKADDDTYTIMENLRYFLKDMNPQEPLSFGEDLWVVRFNGSNRRFMHGGEGYVLSQEAVRRFVRDGIIGKACDDIMNYPFEDAGTTMCTEKLGVKFGKNHDRRQRRRYIGAFTNVTFAKRTGNTFTLDFDRFSNTPIGFHHTSISDMVLVEYLLYHVQVEIAPSSFP